MNYSFLFYVTPDDFALRNDPEKKKAYWAGWEAYTNALRDAGVFVSGGSLQSPETATTLRLHDGQRLVQDGPIADTKEQFGGFYVIDVPDLDTALDWAARCPLSPGMAVEVRPNMS